MGIPQVLDPENRGLIQKKSDHYTEEPLLTHHTRALERIYQDTNKKWEESKDPGKKERLQKTLRALKGILIEQSFKDRQDYLVRNKKNRQSYKDDNRFHPLNTSSSAESSGALLWAHRQGILGEGAEVIVIERVAYVKSPTLSQLIQTTEPTPPESPRGMWFDSVQHASAVTSIVYQVAPKALIRLINDSQVEMAFHPEYVDDKAIQARKIPGLFPEKPLLLNWSGGRIPEERIGGIEAFFKTRSEKFQDLLVKAVPNSGGVFGKEEEDRLFNERVFNMYAPHIILVGNIDNYGKVPVKPFNALQEQRFLCAYGNDILTLDSRDDLKTQDGTSMAAPIISGASALLISKYPGLKPQQAGDILLESAETSFWVSGWAPTFIYNVDDFSEDVLENIRHKIKGVRLEPFSSKTYGRGILSLRRALIYAELKMKHPEASKEDLRVLFKTALDNQQSRAAVKIQRAFRAYKATKKP